MKEEDCKNCNGSGKIHGYCDLVEEFDKHECDKCKGTGKIKT